MRAHAADAIAITGGTSRATPAGAPTGIGYMTISNAGSESDRLVGATSPAVDHVEIHEMAVTDGVMHMRQIPGGLLIPAHGSVELKPGSYHLMLIGPKAPLRAGTTVPVTLTFAHAAPRTIDLAVEPLGGAPTVNGSATP